MENVNSLAPFGRNEWLLVACALLAVAMAVSPPGADPDLWGHVRYGQDVFAEGLARETTYSYTAQRYRWINHENLSELALALGVETIGPAGLLLAKCLLGVMICGAILLIARRNRLALVPTLIGLLLVAANFTNHWNLRPQLASFACFATLILLLEYAFKGWQGHWWLKCDARLMRRDLSVPFEPNNQRLIWLWLCVPLMVVWTNAHGGFVAGFATLSLYLVCRGLELASQRGWASLPTQRHFALILLAAGLATFLNPYGPGLHQWLLAALGNSRPEITEWHPLYSWDAHTFAFIALISATILCPLLSRRPIDFTHMVVLAVVAWQACSHQRHTPFLAMLFGFWVLPHAESVWRRITTEASGSEQETSAADGLGLNAWNTRDWATSGLFLLMIGLFSLALYGRVSEMPVLREVYPVSALKFMDEHDLHGRTVVTYNWAQYFLAARCREGRSQVQFDGRYRTSYPQHVIDQHFDLILGDNPRLRFRGLDSPPFDPTAVLKEGSPDLVLLDRGQPHSTKVMGSQEDEWVLLYQDQLAQLWGRRARFDNPLLADYLPPWVREVGDTPQVGHVAWPGFPMSPGSEPRLASYSAPQRIEIKAEE